MATLKLNGNGFKPLLINGAQSLINDIDRINALNVFPVPDGDTGTNMRLTIEGGVREIASLDEANIGLMFKALSRAMTMSARGNSGVILSQFFKGMTLYLEDKEEVDAKELAMAFDAGTKQAYKVVQKPTEGTILTVMREAGEKVISKDSFENIEAMIASYLTEATLSLDRTPELLPVLKEAGVIDSGGAGFVRIIEGMLQALDGNMLADVSAYIDNQNKSSKGKFNADSVLEYGYCTEFILQLQNAKVDIKNFDIKTITDYLETLGNSIVAFKDDDIVKVHVHTMTPGKVINFCQQFGEYVTFKMENMSVQHSELEEIIPTAMEVEHKEIAVVAVSSGDGISEQYKSLGVDEIVSGGQTMNPSIDDFIKAFDKLDATNIIVFPNNSNIIMAARQAAENYEKANVIVIPTTSMLQCYSALGMIDLTSQGLDEIVETINDTISNVTCCNITYAIRSCEIDGLEIKKGNYMALVNKNIIATSQGKEECVREMFKNYPDAKDKEVVTVFYGVDVTPTELENVEKIIHENCPYAEAYLIEGKQEVYSFLISLE